MTWGAKVPRGARLFGFAVMADSHVEPEPPGGPAPRSNARTRDAVAAIERLAPAFTIHLGDLAHPVPGLPGRAAAVEAVRAILGALSAPLHVTAGNHDIGDKPLAWMPAKTVSQAWLEQHEAAFQRSWQSFRHEGCRFVLVNAPILNSGLPADGVQRAWLEAELDRVRGERIFLFTHYPPHLLDPGEPSHYDNLDEPARGWLLDLLHRHEVEALFAGHVHNRFYDRHGATEICVAPSTSFVRRDYSELFRIAPAAEFGRDDALKLGFLWVDVFERGHRVTFCRTCDGDAPTAAVLRADPLGDRVRAQPDDGRSGRSGLGVDLRHPWSEVVALPYNPPTDAFQRRLVRDDHPLLALWDLAIDAVRVPFADLRDERTRRRLHALAERGLRFTVLHFGPPDGDAARLLAACAPALAALELILPREAVVEMATAVADPRRRTGLPTRLAPLTTSAATLSGGTNLTHFVGHGFLLGDGATIARLMTAPAIRAAFDGVVVRLAWTDDPWDGVAGLAALGRDLDIAIGVDVSLVPTTPDGAHLDDQAIANRVASATFAALAHPEIAVCLDTFMDVDRGYYPRHGLIDRRGNPRPAGRVVGLLHRLVAPPAGPTEATRIVGSGREVLILRGRERLQCLLTGDGHAGPIDLPRRPADRAFLRGASIDLISGDRQPIEVRARPGGPVRLCPRATWPSLALLVVEADDANKPVPPDA